MITSDPATCECRTHPWVTIGMLGHTQANSSDVIRCPDREHCHFGAPIRDGVIAPHYRNMTGRCAWEGLRVRASMPCECGGWPWIRADVLRNVSHEDMILVNPVRAASCPGCRKRVDVEKNRFALHPLKTGGCVWSGIYIATGASVPPRGVPAPASTRV